MFFKHTDMASAIVDISCLPCRRLGTLAVNDQIRRLRRGLWVMQCGVKLKFWATRERTLNFVRVEKVAASIAKQH
jgi:hypothetical protein